MKNILIAIAEGGQIISGISTEGYTETALTKALNAYHSAIDGGTITDLKKEYEDINGAQRWTYIVDMEEEGQDIRDISLILCAFYE